ncbi:MAG: hypothetical protein DRP26_00245 [Candidatus Zixiibacteriota bacterium]|nr:MAG: hypothetical protein DRP26_00245 [candidate division Zixibacteria bacterium]
MVRNNKQVKKVTVFIAVFPMLFFSCGKGIVSPSKLLEKYYGYLKKNDIESANTLWHDSFECGYKLVDWHFAPPLTDQVSLYASYERNVTVVRENENVALMKLDLISGEGDTLRLDYCAKKISDRWKLVNSPEIECANWASVLIGDIVVRHSPTYSYSKLFYSSLAALYGKAKILLGYEDGKKRQVFLVPSQAGVSFLSYSFKLIPSRSFSACGIVFSKYTLESRHRDMININARLAARELIHVVAFDIFGHDGYSVPLLREGLATYFCGTDGIPTEVCMSQAINMVDSIPSLSELLDLDVFYSHRNLYYGAAATFIDFLVNKYGWDKLKEIYKRSSSIEDFKISIESISSLDSLDVMWKNYIRGLHVEIPKTWRGMTDFEI